MTFRAFIRRNSDMFRRWRREARIGGQVSGAFFNWDGRDYVCDSIPPDALQHIMNNHMVHTELATGPVGEVAPVVEMTVPDDDPPKRVTLSLPKRR